MDPKSVIWKFDKPLDKDQVPQLLDYPHYYQPQPWAQQAAEQLMDYLANAHFDQNFFGVDPEDRRPVIGKMFGVLVVEDAAGEVGFLAAFSGKLAESNHHQGFVPPVFDLLDDRGYFLKGEQEIHQITLLVEAKQNALEWEELQTARANLQLRQEEEKAQILASIQQNKNLRKQRRVAQPLDDHLHKILDAESRKEQLALRSWKKSAQKERREIELRYERYFNEILELKVLRKTLSAALQKQIFDSYYFLNSLGEEKSLWSIFANTAFGIPPAGAGECAAPKLFQQAFLMQLKPLCMAEFWWGASPQSEIKVHRQFYPACRGKCEPILQHMLRGLEIGENPLLQPIQYKNIQLSVLFEDEHMVIVNKPHEMLSVPGKVEAISVQQVLKEKYGSLCPGLVHRLDMSTSGILVFAKTPQAYQQLQQQFVKRKVLKIYRAILTQKIQGNRIIQLPLTQNILDRPKQMVDFETGKEAITEVKLVNTKNDFSEVLFYPKTGRTHQLRVHAAHYKGLNAPILGDDLYGQPADRLHLHAESLSFYHPVKNNWMTVDCAAPFSLSFL